MVDGAMNHKGFMDPEENFKAGVIGITVHSIFVCWGIMWHLKFTKVKRN